ncbi:hypothetical protein I317_06513 [Kwoniella heveanensis CBS 569]|nr:hypothetical protein I317_06513 [Kwoniella heveanensis CBS 569]
MSAVAQSRRSNLMTSTWTSTNIDTTSHMPFDQPETADGATATASLASSSAPPVTLTSHLNLNKSSEAAGAGAEGYWITPAFLDPKSITSYVPRHEFDTQCELETPSPITPPNSRRSDSEESEGSFLEFSTKHRHRKRPSGHHHNLYHHYDPKYSHESNHDGHEGRLPLQTTMDSDSDSDSDSDIQTPLPVTPANSLSGSESSYLEFFTRKKHGQRDHARGHGSDQQYRDSRRHEGNGHFPPQTPFVTRAHPNQVEDKTSIGRDRETQRGGADLAPTPHRQSWRQMPLDSS